MKEYSNPCISFTERENLYDQVSHVRFMALVLQPDMDIHEVKEDSNSFGEYLFVTLSCRTEQPKRLLTFWGLGYHDHRERWIVDSWQWFESQRNMNGLPQIDKEEANAQIKEREAFVRTNATPNAQSPRGQLYEVIADLTDEDSALSELEDLGWIFLNVNDDGTTK
ncbi:MAG: hypothetical protein H0X31_02105 [Nostocaceae cyanobacterium]|nr:hypothetical protein [Nostocaceae cyanobacterium]